MSMHPAQLRELISDVLKSMQMHSDAAVELLMMTTATETHCGRYIKQVRGPALGIFQMEPFTHSDIYTSFLNLNPKIKEKVQNFLIRHPAYSEEIADINQRANLPYQIAMARIFYLRFREALPDHSDLRAMATYYKKYWNTPLGKATVENTMKDYERFAI